MGNIFNKDQVKLKTNNSLNQLLLTENKEDLEIRIKKLEQNQLSLKNSYNNIVSTYSETVNEIKTEILNIGNKNNELNKVIRTLHIVNNENIEKISKLEKKMIGIESNDEFLSTVDLDE